MFVVAKLCRRPPISGTHYKKPSSNMPYKISLFLMAMLYVVAGINHFVHPEGYLEIMPPYLPYHKALVVMSGIIETILGILLLPHFSRRSAAWGIIALLIAVFPANLQMAANWHHTNHPHLWIAYARLPLQLLLIGWAYIYTKQHN